MNQMQATMGDLRRRLRTMPVIEQAKSIIGRFGSTSTPPSRRWSSHTKVQAGVPAM
jgi:hypothetical protein